VLPWRVRSDGRHRCPQAHLWTPGTNKGTRMSHSTLRRRFAAGLTAVATAAGLVVGAPALVGAQPTEQGSSASLASAGPAGAGSPAGVVGGAPPVVGAPPTERGSSASRGSEGPADARLPPAPAAQAAVAGGEDPTNNRGVLRNGCVYDPVQSWVQLCTVHSPSMNRDITVQVQAARNNGNAGLSLLAGPPARDGRTAWAPA